MAIRVGIGGWTYEPWRGVFYPPKLPHKRELEYASRQVSAIEINGTFYSRFKPESYATWARTAPDGFVFAVKGSRYCISRPKLAEAEDALAGFFAQGLEELGDKLGPILWQFSERRRFDPDDLRGFLQLLPRELKGLPLRHAIHARHESFGAAEFVALTREAGVALVYAESDKYPAVADVSGGFAYVRLERAREGLERGYPEDELDRWADAARTWAAGGAPADLPYVAAEPAPERPRDVFVFAINGAKVRAPAVATALIGRLSG